MDWSVHHINKIRHKIQETSEDWYCLCLVYLAVSMFVAPAPLLDLATEGSTGYLCDRELADARTLPSLDSICIATKMNYFTLVDRMQSWKTATLSCHTLLPFPLWMVAYSVSCLPPPLWVIYRPLFKQILLNFGLLGIMSIRTFKSILLGVSCCNRTRTPFLFVRTEPGVSICVPNA